MKLFVGPSQYARLVAFDPTLRSILVLTQEIPMAKKPAKPPKKPGKKGC